MIFLSHTTRHGFDSGKPKEPQNFVNVFEVLQCEILKRGRK